MLSVVILYLYLPPELQREILSYGDPERTQKHTKLLKQINYYKREFIYQSRYNISGCFYNRNEYFFTRYAFEKFNQKKHAKLRQKRCNHDCCRLTRRRIPFPVGTYKFNSTNI
tara:strand:+ start:2461 stop:2799 length:339 start_codon:yes stop_codon:yes gene_type:complete